MRPAAAAARTAAVSPYSVERRISAPRTPWRSGTRWSSFEASTSRTRRSRKTARTRTSQRWTPALRRCQAALTAVATAAPSSLPAAATPKIHSFPQQNFYSRETFIHERKISTTDLDHQRRPTSVTTPPGSHDSGDITSLLRHTQVKLKRGVLILFCSIQNRNVSISRNTISSQSSTSPLSTESRMKTIILKRRSFAKAVLPCYSPQNFLINNSRQ